jgi:hypothetical protein
MLLRIVQSHTFKQIVGQGLAFIFSLDMRRSIKAIGWSYRMAEELCPVCHSRRIEVYDEGKNRLMVEDIGPHDRYVGEVCDCAWLSPTPPPEGRGRHNPVWISQRTVERIEKRQRKVDIQPKKGRGWIHPRRTPLS